MSAGDLSVVNIISIGWNYPHPVTVTTRIIPSFKRESPETFIWHQPRCTDQVPAAELGSKQAAWDFDKLKLGSGLCCRGDHKLSVVVLGWIFFDIIRWEESLVVKLEYSICCFKDDEASTTLVKLYRTETKLLSYHVPPCHSTTEL